MTGEAETFRHLVGLSGAILLLVMGLRGLRGQTGEVVGAYSWANLGFGLLLVFGITIPMAIGWFGMLQWWFRLLENIYQTWTIVVDFLVVLGLFVVIRYVSLGRLFSDWSLRRFTLIVLGIGTSLKLAYVLLIDTTPVSDFGFMWELSSAIVEKRWPHSEEVYQSLSLCAPTNEFCGHLSLTVRLFLQRCLGFFIPLIYLFGKSPLAYEFANVLTLSLCAVIVCSLARRWFGNQIAKGVLILTMIVPETFFSAAIPTHDIPGTFYLLLSLWLLDSIIIRPSRVVSNLLLSLILGCTLTLMEIQRDMGLFWFLAIGIYLVVQIFWRRAMLFEKRSLPSQMLRAKLVQLTVFLALSWIGYQGCYELLHQQGWVMSRHQRRHYRSILFVANSDSWGDGLWTHAYKNYYRIYEGLYSNAGMGVEDWQKLAWVKFLADAYYNPLERLRNYFRKSYPLYALGTQSAYYYSDGALKPNSPLSGIWLERALKGHNINFVLIFSPIFIYASLVFLWRRGIPHRLMPAISVLAIQSLVLLVVGECQPRYMFPIWFIGPVVIGAQFGDWLKVSEEPEKTGTKARRLLPMMAVILGIALLGLVGLRWVAHVSDIRMLDFSQWTEVKANYSLPPGNYLESLQSKIVAKRHFQLALAHGRVPKTGDVIKVSKSYPFEDDYPRTFKVFAHSSYEDPNSDFAVNAFTMMISINAQVVRHFPVAELRSARQIVVEDIVPKNGDIEITFAIKANADATGVSWQRASLVYFEFPQLYRDENPTIP